MNTLRFVELAAQVAAAHLHGARMLTQDVPGFIRTIHATLLDLVGDGDGLQAHRSASLDGRLPPDDASSVALASAPSDMGEDNSAASSPHPDTEGADVSGGFVRKGVRTVFDDHLVCLEDGRDVVFLSRRLRHLGIDPDAYRTKWSLPPEYPMVAPGYSRVKRELAMRSRFGTLIRPKRDSRLRGTLKPVYA